MRNDYRKNFLAEALGAVRKVASTLYGDSENGSEGKVEIVRDKTYRDKAGIRMADERFKMCLLEWYCSIRRVGMMLKNSFLDISKLEFTRAELALVDLEVQRLLQGDVQKTTGFNMGRSREIHAKYVASLSVVQSWRVSDVSPDINIVHPDAVLGKADKHNLYLDATSMQEKREK